MKKTESAQTVIMTAIAIFFIVGMLATITQAAEPVKSPWLVRARLLGVLPDDESTDISVIGGKAEVDDSITGDVDFSYFFTDNLALELTLTISPHDVNAVDTTVGNLDLGDVSLLPPTLTLQYHFLPDNRFRPYIGAGLNYTIFFNEDSGVAHDIDYDNAVGYALQAGIDIGLDDHWAINIDVKKLWLNTDVSVHALGTIVHTDVDIDPWLFGFGVAYRF